MQLSCILGIEVTLLVRLVTAQKNVFLVASEHLVHRRQPVAHTVLRRELTPLILAHLLDVNNAALLADRLNNLVLVTVRVEKRLFARYSHVWTLTA